MTSQLVSQPLYNTRGERDTTNASDLVIPGHAAEHAFQTQRMEDGAMLAWKAIVIRSSLSTPTCKVGPGDMPLPGPGGGGGGMP